MGKLFKLAILGVIITFIPAVAFFDFLITTLSFMMSENQFSVGVYEERIWFGSLDSRVWIPIFHFAFTVICFAVFFPCLITVVRELICERKEQNQIAKTMRIKLSNWLPVGVTSLVMGITLIFISAYADSYSDYRRTPYRSLALPLLMIATCMIIIGIFALWFNSISWEENIRERQSYTQ